MSTTKNLSKTLKIDLTTNIYILKLEGGKSIGGEKSSGLRYNTCSRCGRVGHNASKCYARTDVDGDEYDSE
jgi:hypothetical protein